jgi:hypothetical protein
MKLIIKKFARHLANHLGYDIKSRGVWYKDQQVARLIYFHKLVSNALRVKGSIVECGVGGGESLILIKRIMQEYPDKSRCVFAFDSFEGFPELSQHDTTGHAGYCKWDLDFVKKNLRNFLSEADVDSIKFRKGFFSDTLPDSKSDIDRIAFLHIDVDLYQSYIDVLENLYDLVSIGGVICFDEFLDQQEKWPGAVRAIQEFFVGKGQEFTRDAFAKRYYIVKQ